MYVVIFITTVNKKESEKIARALVSKNMAACVNIVEQVNSLFKWKGKLERQREFLLIVKSKKSLMPKLIKLVKSLHSYNVPEIIALPIIAGNKEYLDWLGESTR